MKKLPKVVGISEDGEITEYTGHSVRKLKSLEDSYRNGNG